ncbi:MAG: hypothetical protein IJV47_02460, partial [Candidatus Methanomethylophilaceae archaeon]|nr:hypothetical protein [Candidatus Methanomethylophilaceae archaeon]MBQ9689459.1 hypothetical protein [Candidatus Methanomethylophilaceae archaeon]
GEPYYEITIEHFNEKAESSWPPIDGMTLCIECYKQFEKAFKGMLKCRYIKYDPHVCPECGEPIVRCGENSRDKYLLYWCIHCKKAYKVTVEGMDIRRPNHDPAWLEYYMESKEEGE